MSQLKREHGTIKAYVIGFLLSLVFTFIPFYLVEDQVVKGSLLLATILGFGVVQMIVQVTFFLHLGRGPKPNWNFFFFMATIGAILVVVGGSVVITRNLHYNMTPTDQTKKLINDEAIYQIGGEKTGACLGQHANHQIIIKNGTVSPAHTVAARCDTLTFTNQDSEVKDIAFGEHPDHKTYAGETEYIIRSGKNKTITLSESGVYKFHDHLQPDTAGDFLVTP